MKRLTIDQTWEQCLAMWKWIDLRIRRKSGKSVEALKKYWLEKNSIDKDDLMAQCFFCEKADQDSKENDSGWFYPGCRECPAKKIDSSFNCESGEYRYKEYPRLFYAELKRLNKIRLGAK